MDSLVLDLQYDVLKQDCDILIALRKAHLIAAKLKLTEFDNWIQQELNGYEGAQESVPEYRKVKGQLQAWNPYRGWVPVVVQDSKLEEVLCNRKLIESIGDILELHEKAKDRFTISFSGDINAMLDEQCDSPFPTNYSLLVSTHKLKSIIEKVKNCLLEWTIRLEEKGIIGEGMRFNKDEEASARFVPQQINNYYGNVINGSVNKSQIVSGNQNELTFSIDDMTKLVEEIKTSLEKENIDDENKEQAIELVDELSAKVMKNKKPGIIKAALAALKDFLLNAGANITAAIIVSKMQGM
ncbi:MAG: ABC transporter substrate-binding protein [Clostridia bacterium]|nr:ABC transporter substrate-binding protein [Clostridia bacterium]